MSIDSVPSDFVDKWICYISNISTADIWCSIVGIVSVIIIALTPKFSKKIPGSLVAIIVMTIAALLLKQYCGITSIETIGDRFNVSNEIPNMQVPAMTWDTIKSLVPPALTIAVLGAIESLLSATVVFFFFWENN